MSFTYEPLTEDEINSQSLIPDGIYDFETTKAEYKVNPNSGNKIINLTLKVWDAEGRESQVFTRLINLKSMMYKTKHYCDSTGLQKEYLENRFNESMCVGRCGKAHIITKKGGANPEGAYYKDRNDVKDFIASDSKIETKKTESSSSDFFNDDIDL